MSIQLIRAHRHNERVRHARDGIGQLPGQLDVVLVEPTSGDHSKAIIGSDRRLGEEPGQELGEHRSDRNSNIWFLNTYVPENTTNPVGRKNIERIIVPESELELGRKIANRAGQESEKYGGSCAGKTVLPLSVKSLDSL